MKTEKSVVDLPVVNGMIGMGKPCLLYGSSTSSGESEVDNEL